jgi:NAD(P)-dependent dehydrogenase (short-subunit alcohol dehydrogenase family)
MPGTSPIEDQPIRNPINDTSTILIVGGTRSIGLEFVKQCLAKGATVVATHRSEHLPSTLLDLQGTYSSTSTSGHLFGLQMDLADEESIRAAALAYQSLNVSPLTHIIHNAGIYRPETSFDGTPRGPRPSAPKVTKDAMMESFAINSIAPILVAQNFVSLCASNTTTSTSAVLPAWAFVSSKVGSVDDNGSGGAYAYRSSKAALNQIAKSLSIDLVGQASVVLLHPGYVKTDMTGGKGLIDTETSVGGMMKAIEATDENVGFRFVDYKACLIPW